MRGRLRLRVLLGLDLIVQKRLKGNRQGQTCAFAPFVTQDDRDTKAELADRLSHAHGKNLEALRLGRGRRLFFLLFFRGRPAVFERQPCVLHHEVAGVGFGGFIEDPRFKRISDCEISLAGARRPMK